MDVAHGIDSRTRIGRKRKIHSMLLTERSEPIGNVPRSDFAFATSVCKEFHAFMLIPSRQADDESSVPLLFWGEEEANGRLPYLCVIAKLLFGPPIASTESERVFSVADLNRAKNRARLGSDNLEKVLKIGFFLPSEGRI